MRLCYAITRSITYQYTDIYICCKLLRVLVVYLIVNSLLKVLVVYLCVDSLLLKMYICFVIALVVCYIKLYLLV